MDTDIEKVDNEISQFNGYPENSQTIMSHEKSKGTGKSLNYDLDFYVNNTSIYNRSPTRELKYNVQKINKLDSSESIHDFIKNWNDTVFLHAKHIFKDHDTERIFKHKLNNARNKDTSLSPFGNNRYKTISSPYRSPPKYSSLSASPISNYIYIYIYNIYIYIYNIYILEPIEQSMRKHVKFPNSLTTVPSIKKLNPKEEELNEDLLPYIKEPFLPPIQNTEILSPKIERKKGREKSKSLLKDRKSPSPIRRMLDEFESLKYDPVNPGNRSFSNATSFILKKNKHKKQKPRELLQKLFPLNDVILFYVQYIENEENRRRFATNIK